MPARRAGLFIQLISLACLAFLTPGCGGGKPAVSVPAPVQPPAQVRLGYFANLTHAQALIGVARGDFQTALGAIPLKTFTFNAGPSVVEAFFAGELDLAYVGPSPAINAFVKSHGTAIRLISGVAANGVVIVAAKGSGITKLADLKGKKLATPQYGNTQDVSARIYVTHTLGEKLKRDGGATDILPTNNAEQIGLLKRGLIDAAWVPEPWGARMVHEADGVIIAEEKDLWEGKHFSTAVVVVSTKFLEQYPDIVEKFLAVHASLTDWINAHRDEAATAANVEIKKLTLKALPPDVLNEAFARIEFGTDPLAASVQKFADWAHELGIAQEEPDLKNLFDLRPLEKVRGKK